MTEEQKKEIDAMSYEALLRRWRFSASIDTIFHGESGKYYADVMAKKKAELTHDEQVQASKNIGWIHAGGTSRV